MGLYMVNNIKYTVESLLENNISILDEGINNSVIFEELPKLPGKDSMLVITFKGNNNRVNIGRNICINRKINISFIPQPNMFVDNCSVELGGALYIMVRYILNV